MPGIGADRALDQRRDAAELMDYALEGDGMLRTMMVSPTMELHLVADSRRQKGTPSCWTRTWWLAMAPASRTSVRGFSPEDTFSGGPCAIAQGRRVC